jgi:hypothetical protein
MPDEIRKITDRKERAAAAILTLISGVDKSFAYN